MRFECDYMILNIQNQIISCNESMKRAVEIHVGCASVVLSSDNQLFRYLVNFDYLRN